MLDSNLGNLKQIVSALINYHRLGTLPAPPPDGVTLENGACIVTYGYNGTPYGRLKFAGGQFELNQVTTPQGAWTSFAYNHDLSAKTTQQGYCDALKCNNLAFNSALLSSIIVLTSESCRSALIFAVVQKQFESNTAINDSAWAGMTFCITNYKNTADECGYDIAPKAKVWAPLETKDYQNYIDSPKYTGDKAKTAKCLNALYAFSLPG